MKKILSILLSIMLLVSFCATAFAEGNVSYTPQDVMAWLDENEELAETTAEQAVNGSHRLTEMLVYLTAMNANDEQLDTLDYVLTELQASRESEDATVSQQIAIGVMSVVRVLEVLAHESDPEGVYDDNLNLIMDTYYEGDEAAEDVDQQIVNALYSAVKLMTIITEESCSFQEQYDQIEEGYQQFAADDEAAESVDAQKAVGARWLFKMLGAFEKLHNPNCIDMIELLTERVEANVEGSESYTQVLTQWLYGSVYRLAIFMGALTLE